MIGTFTFLGGTIRFPAGAIQYRGLGTASAGARLRILGRNGSGKTSLSRALGAVIPHVYHAQVELDGNVNDVPLKTAIDALPGAIRVLPQNSQEYLLGLTAIEEWDLATRHSTLDAGLHHTIYQACELGEFGERSSWDLSDGERRRLALGCYLTQAGTIADGPRWLVMDEWTAHLDSRWIAKFDALIDDLVRISSCGTLELFSCEPVPGAYQPLMSTNGFRAEQSNVSLPARLDALHDLLTRFASRPASEEIAVVHNGRLRTPTLKADVGSLEIAPGCLALITGRNGAGKSTLLKGLRIASRGWHKCRPCLIFADPTLQIVGPNLGQILTQSISPYSNSPIGDAASLLAKVLLVPIDRDPLELNFAAKKLVALVLGVLNNNMALAVDEPFEGLDHDGQQVAVAALRYALVEQRKAVMVTSPSTLPVELQKDFKPIVVNLKKAPGAS